jgi:tetratricopeptide (TPR) repeat protein
VGAVAVLALVAILAGGWVAAGDPLTRIQHGWQSFKGGYTTEGGKSSRLTSGLGSNRYDFYRVALDEFQAHPLAGIGADNYAQQYLEHGHSQETPHYPHSVELRTLTETGLLGGLLALVGVGAALLGAWRALTATDSLVRAVAAAALAGFAYWAVHGSVDWFWEFAGLGAPAFALLGLACGLAPRQVSDGPPRVLPRALVLGGGIAALVITVSLAAPWLSQLQVENAARIWPAAPGKAYAHLNDAARLNPLSDEPYLVAGSIALRFGDLARADHEFALALGRVPTDAYAALERGAIASAGNDRRQALALLHKAANLNPRDPTTRQALLAVLHGERLDVQQLNHSILTEAQQLS